MSGLLMNVRGSQCLVCRLDKSTLRCRKDTNRGAVDGCCVGETSVRRRGVGGGGRDKSCLGDAATRYHRGAWGHSRVSCELYYTSRM